MFFVAIFSNKVIGTIGLKIIKDFAIIRKMFVMKEYRNNTNNERGELCSRLYETSKRSSSDLDGKLYNSLSVAQNLLNALENKTKLESINKIYLGTIDILKAAHRFYEKNHYREIYKSNLPKDFPIINVDNKFYCKEL